MLKIKNKKTPYAKVAVIGSGQYASELLPVLSLQPFYRKRNSIVHFVSRELHEVALNEPTVLEI